MALATTGTQRRRLLWQMGFFILFVMAPVFDVLRYDLTRSHAIVFGMEWRLGLDAFFAGQISGTEAAVNILLWLLLPIGVWVLLAVATVAALLLQRTVFGRRVTAIGSSRQTARLCGVSVPRTELLVYLGPHPFGTAKPR